jgi:hypothetical protein
MAGGTAALLSTDPPCCVDYTGADRSQASGEDWSSKYREVELKGLDEFLRAVLKAVLPRTRDDAAIYAWHAQCSSAMASPTPPALRAHGLRVLTSRETALAHCRAPGRSVVAGGPLRRGRSRNSRGSTAEGRILGSHSAKTAMTVYDYRDGLVSPLTLGRERG